MRTSRSLIALTAAIAAAASGCGTGDDREQARTVVERFYAAVRAGDGARACAQLSAATASALEDQEQRPCAQAVEELDLRTGAAVGPAVVYVTAAKVDLHGGESAFLDREPTGWKLTAVGCRPEQGKPTARPMTCELEA